MYKVLAHPHNETLMFPIVLNSSKLAQFIKDAISPLPERFDVTKRVTLFSYSSSLYLLIKYQSSIKDPETLQFINDLKAKFFTPFFKKQLPFWVVARPNEIDQKILSILSLPTVGTSDSEKGKGLVALDDIPKGTIVCYGDFNHTIQIQNLRSNNSILTCCTMPGELRATVETREHLTPQDGFSLVNDPVYNPVLSALLKQGRWDEFSRLYAFLDKKTPSNLVPKNTNGIPYFISTRDIKKGEALEWSYGPQYWINQHIRQGYLDGSLDLESIIEKINKKNLDTLSNWEMSLLALYHSSRNEVCPNTYAFIRHITDPKKPLNKCMIESFIKIECEINSYPTLLSLQITLLQDLTRCKNSLLKILGYLNYQEELKNESFSGQLLEAMLYGIHDITPLFKISNPLSLKQAEIE